MKVLLQRVSKAHVAIEKKIVEEISTGLLLLLGIENGDSQKDVDYLVSKISNLRLFSSAKSQFDRSVLDVKGEILIISQFTLCGDCNKGRRPDFTNAAPPAVAQELYNKFVQKFLPLSPFDPA